MSSLFEDQAPRPLADSLRPQSLEEVIGQDHLLAEDGPIGRMVANGGRLTSMILWGPPGCGKTTVARLLADKTDLYFEPLSAIFSGVADLKKVFKDAKMRREGGQGTLLFIDEIHRFNRAQQDGFLPFVEDGTVVLVGATTENPSFELNAALMSRCRVMVLNRLSDDALEGLLGRAEAEKKRDLPLDEDARASLRAMADGDGRYLLNMVEAVYEVPDGEVLGTDTLSQVVQKRMPIYDKSQEGHYNLISAFQKSLRGSDADAALYWFARMLDGGEDPKYIARRLLITSVEDVGTADPNAMTQALQAWESYERLGSPQGEYALAQAVVYVATAPKSNASYVSYKAARDMAKRTGSLMPPKHILNAPTKMMKEIGYGEGYQYDHDAEDGFSGQDFFPEELGRQQFYHPKDKGFERELSKRQAYWAKLRREKW
ncbi:replication-associated recombination protein A [Terasakiella sp. A23]|uniref:replication-associated recombination protein A n=1 Tax=Terasakiella sp. FCG-A23 TaxID=3080561 RepID=UPI0029544B2E|nr:replication-associated recombination protein A [Terasakiella sp. A23]MDV7338501.1 replication-associated recombination protein A [Terasakiella sp. A23]